MKQDGWRERFLAQIEAKDLSQRAVSLRAGRGPGYVNSLLNDGKEPSVDNLIEICNAAGISVYSVLFDVEMSPETEEIVFRLQHAPKETRDALLKLLPPKPAENDQ